MGETAAIEDPAERRTQAGRGGGIGPPRRALVDSDSEQPLAVVRLARTGDQVEIQIAPAVYVPPANLPAREVEGRRKPILL